MRLLDSIYFEHTLKEVRIPQCNLDSDDTYGFESLTSSIFHKLFHSKGIKKIISVVVNDDAGHPHSDLAIVQALREFHVEEWDWKKTNLCSEVIYEAARSTRKIRLYSSGNRGVLRSWSAEDGLQKLEMVGLNLSTSQITQ